MKSSKNTTPETKADMIAILLERGGLKASEVAAKVKEVYATCYYSEITRVKNKMIKDTAKA